MKYVKVEWPDIQEFMNNPDWDEECYFNPIKNVWFVPEDLDPYDSNLGGDIGDLEDAMG